MSLSNLLAFLGRSPLLESVHVDFHGECIQDAPGQMVIPLEALKTLHISGSGLVGHGENSLLARLELPKGVDVTVMLLIPDGSSNVVSRAIPPHPERLPFVTGIKRVRIRVAPEHGRCTLQFSGENGKATVMVRWKITDPDLDDLVMKSIQSFLPLSTEGVEEFSIQGYQAYSHVPALRAFGSLPNLESIIVVHCDNIALLRALRQPAGDVIAPKLRRVRLYLDPGKDASGEELMELVKFRAANDVKLEKFLIISPDVIIPVAEVMALKSHVGVVEYRMDDIIPGFEDQ